MSTPRLFDKTAIAAHRRRALRAGLDAPPLLAHAAADLFDRLALIRRSFALAVDLATPGGDLAAALARGPQVGAVVRLAEEPAFLGAGPFSRVVGTPEALPFAPGSLDLVVSALALQAVDDLPGALLQIRRALRPDGLFLAVLPGAGTLAELREAIGHAEAELEGRMSPRVAPFADVRDLGGLLQRAGFALPVTDVERVTLRYAHPLGLLHDLRALGATNPLVERHRGGLRRATLLRAMEIYAERFADPDGKVRASVELIALLGWAPHESQQQPLKPGSARMRLADALKPPPKG